MMSSTSYDVRSRLYQNLDYQSKAQTSTCENNFRHRANVYRLRRIKNRWKCWKIHIRKLFTCCVRSLAIFLAICRKANFLCHFPTFFPMRSSKSLIAKLTKVFFLQHEVFFVAWIIALTVRFLIHSLRWSSHNCHKSDLCLPDKDFLILLINSFPNHFTWQLFSNSRTAPDLQRQRCYAS